MMQVFLNFILFFIPVQDDKTVVKIEHVGASDKFIPSLCISVSMSNCAESAYETAVLVNRSEMRAIEKFVRDNEVSIEFNSENAYEVGSFKIFIMKNDTIDVSYVLDKRVDSIKYLNLLQTDLVSSEKNNLQDELSNVLKRIDY